MTFLGRNVDNFEDLSGTLFRSDGSKVFKLCTHLGCSGPSHIGSDNPGTTLSAAVHDASGYDILDWEGNDIIHLLVDLLGDKVGTCFTEAVTVERVRETILDLPSSTGDDDKLCNLGRVQEGSEGLEEDQWADSVGGEIPLKSFGGCGKDGLNARMGS